MNIINNTNIQQKPKAFISCSLRTADQPFVNYVIKIVQAFDLEPMGTIGKYCAAPQPPGLQMREEIKNADCIVIVATPRYFQQDVEDKSKISKGISEMLHTEIGMAVANGKPILAFVLEGTDVGSFLPQTTQYIVLKNNDKEDLQKNWKLIDCYFKKAASIIQNNWKDQKIKNFWKFTGYGFSALGVATFLKNIFNYEDDDYYDDD